MNETMGSISGTQKERRERGGREREGKRGGGRKRESEGERKGMTKGGE